MMHIANTPARCLLSEPQRHTTQGRRIVKGEPRATATKSAAELSSLGFVGLYAAEDGTQSHKEPYRD